MKITFKILQLLFAPKYFILLLSLSYLTSNAQNILNTSINNSHLCLGGTYTVTFTTSGSFPSATFTAKLSDVNGNFSSPTNVGTSTTNSITITIQSGTALSNNYRLVVNSSTSLLTCDTLSGLTITKPTANFSFTNNLCAGSNVSFSNTSTGNGVGISNYSWNFSATSGAPSSPNTSASPTVSFNPSNGSGTEIYNVILTATDSFGCTNTANQNISVRKLPSTSFTFNNNVCASSSVNFNNTSNGNGPLSCVWNFGATTGAPSNNTNFSPSVIFNAGYGASPLTYNTTLTVTDVYGCSNSSNQNVTINQVPEVGFDTTNLTSSALFDPVLNLFKNCFATRLSPNFQFSVGNISSTNTTNSNYFINWGDGSPNTTGSIYTIASHLYTTLGLFSISIGTTGNNGCQTSRTYQFFNGNSPSGNLISIPNVNDCVPYTLTWPIDTTTTNQNAPGTTYIFRVNDGTPPIYFTQTNLPLTISHTFTNSSCNFPPSNSYKVEFVSINPCDSNPTVVGTVRPAQRPIASFTISPTNIGCNNTSMTFNNTSIGNYFNGSNCLTTFEKYWEITPNTGWTIISGILSPNITSITGSNSITINFSISGNYTIKLKIKKPNTLLQIGRCIEDSTIQNICIQPTPSPNFTLNQNPSNQCINNIINVNNTSNTLLSCGSPVYVWSVWDSLTSLEIKPAARFSYLSGTDSSSVNPIFSFSQKGRYKIRLQIVNKCAGTFVKDTFIIIKDKPLVSLPSNINYCDSQTITFNFGSINHKTIYDSSYGTISSYNWKIIPNTGFTFTSGDSTSKYPTIKFINYTTSPITYKVILSATNECGVSVPDTQNITINPRPQASAISIPSKMAFCSGGTTNIILSNNLSSVVRYTWRAYGSSSKISGFSNQLTGVTGPIIQTLINTGSVNETVLYRIVAKDTLTGCLGDSTSIIITVYPIPRVIASSQNICSGSQTNIALSSNVSGTLFTWSAIARGSTTGFRDTTNAVSGPIINTLVNSSFLRDTVIYAIKATANGCVSLDTLIRVIVYPIPSSSGGFANICSNDTAKYTATSSVSGTTFTYTASLINGNAIGFSNGNGSINQKLTNTGNTDALVRYTITPTGPLPTLCPGQPVNFDVTIKPKPILTVTSSSSICSGSQTNIALNSSVTNTFYKYTATLISGTNATGYFNPLTDVSGPIAQVISNTGGVNSLVRYTIIPTANLCKGDTQYHDVTIFPGVNAGSISAPATVCAGTNTGTLNLTGNTGAVVRWEQSVSPFNSWTIINNLNSTQNYSNLTQTTWYRAVIQSGGFCPTVNTSPLVITVDSPSIAGNLLGIDTVCTGINSGILTLINKRGNIVNWQLSTALPTWNNIGTTIVNPDTFYNLTQTTWFRVVVKNGVCPLSISDSFRIQVDAQPSQALAPDKAICAISLTLGTNGNITANPISTGTGLWTSLSGPNAPTIVNPNASTSAINNLAIGIHNILWQVSNGKCPSSKDTLNLVVYPPIQSSISDSQVICSGQAPTTLIGTIPTGGNGIYSYQWESSTDGNIWVNIVSATNKDYQPSTLTSSTWYRRKVVSNVCNQTSNLVYIQVLPSISNNTITPNAAICIGGSSPMIIGSSPNGGNSIYTFQWQKYNGNTWENLTTADTLKDYNPGILLNTTIFRRIVSSSFCNGLQASISNTDTITINPLPIVNAGNDSSKCQNQTTYNLNGSPSGGTWSGIGVLNNTFNPSAMPLGTYTLVYTYTNANGCTNHDTTLINVIAIPNVDAGNNISVCQNAAAFQLSGFTPSSGGSWSGPAVTSSGMFNPIAAGAGIFKLFYNFTAGTGCSGLDSLLVTVNPKPSPNFTLPPKICPNNSIVLTTTTNTVATVSGYNWIVTNNGSLSNNILSSYNTANPIATFPENKTSTDITYNIKLITITNNGCIDSVSNPVLLLKRPFAQFTTGSNINCGPVVYTLTNGTSNVTSSYIWSTNPSASVNINSSTSIAPQITFPVNTSASAIVYNIQLIATRNDGIASCMDTAIVPITVYPKPMIGFTSLPSDSGCSPLTVNFSNTSNPQNTENINTMSFLWNFGIYGSDTARNPQRTFTNSGIVDNITNVKVIGTSKWGCKDSLTQKITVFPFPKANFSSGNYAYCAPLTIDSSNITLVPYPIANSQYLWQIINKAGSILSSYTGTGIPTYTINTPNDTIYYRLITSHTRGCKPDTLTRMFITIANPTPNFSMSDSVGCTPLSVNISNTSTPNLTYVWTISNGAIPANTNPFALTFTNSSNTVNKIDSVKLVIIAGTGCRDSITKYISVYPKPKAIFSLPNIICADTFKTATNASVFKGTSASYIWSFLNNTNNSISNTTAPTPIFTFINNQTGIDSNYAIRLRVTSTDGCVHDTTQNITIYKRPLVVFSVPITTCGPANVTISNTTVLNSNWSWISFPALSFNTATSQNPIVTFPLNNTADSINYRIKLTATRAGYACIDTTDRWVTIYPKPAAAFTTIAKDSCGPRLVTFTNTSNANNGESAGSMSYLWTILNNTFSSTNASATFTNAGTIDSTYNARLIATSKHGCKDTTNTIVKVYPDAKALFNFSNNIACAPFVINASNVIANLYSNANSSYKWYANNDLIGIINTFPGYTLSTANDSVLIKLVTTSLNGCKNDSIQVWFRTIPNPKPNFTAIDSIGCTPLSVTFNNTSTIGVISSWTFNNGFLPPNPNSFSTTFNNFLNTRDTTYTVKLFITAGSGCKDSLIKNIIVYPKPKAIFSLPSIICADTFKTASNSTIYKPSTVAYGWRFLNNTNNSISDTTAATPVFTFINNQTGNDSTYTVRLRATSVNGCIHDTTQNISIYKRPLALFSSPITTCGSANVLLSNTTALNSNWFWSSTPILSFNTATSQNPTVLFPLNTSNDSINYRIKLTATRLGSSCVDTANKLITIYPKPQAAFVTMTQDSCGPRIVKFTNTSSAKNGESLGTMSYLWTILNNSFSTTNANSTFTNTGVVDSSYNARLIVNSMHGCKDTANNLVKVYPNAKALFNFTSNTACAPFIINPSNVIAVDFANANNLYKWYRNDTLIGTGLAFPTQIIPRANDSILIKLVAYSLNNCKNDSMQVWFKTIPNPKPNFTAIDSIGCTSLIVSFNNTSNPISGVGFKWEFGNKLNVSTQTNPTFTFYNYGITDTIAFTKLIITANGTGCTDSITKPIVIKPLPRPALNLSDSILCYPNLLTVTNISFNVPLYDINGFKWKTVGPDLALLLNDTASQSTTIRFPDNKTGANKFYQIGLQIRSDYGCIDSTKKTVRIPTRPVSSFNFSTDSSCAPVIINTNNTAQYTNTYRWSSIKPNVIINTPSTINTSIIFPSHKGTFDSIYPITLISQTIAGCFDTIVKPFKVFPLPIAGFNLDIDSGCSPIKIRIKNLTIAKKPTSNFWDFGDGSKQIINSDSFDRTFIGSIFNDTTYTIKLVSSSKDGCKDSTTKTIKVKSSAYAKIKLSDTILCSNAINPAKLKIDNKSYGSVDTFYWDFGNGTQLITSKDTSINHPYNIEGIYTIRLKAINNCKTSYDSTQIKVLVPPLLNFFKSDSIGCSPLNVTFSNNSTNLFDAKYLWNFGNGITSILKKPPTITFLQSRTVDTTYIITLQISNACYKSSIIDSIKVHPKPVVDFSLSADSICSGSSIFVLNKTVGLPDYLKWNFGKSTSDTSNRYYPDPNLFKYTTLDTISIYTIKLFASNTCGSDSLTRVLKVLPNNVKSLFKSSGNFICVGDTVFFQNSSKSGNYFSWDFGDGSGLSSQFNATHVYLKAGNFLTRLNVNDGCGFDTSSIEIKVNPIPQFSISKSNTQICVNNPIQFYASLQDSGTIIWYFGDGDSSIYRNASHAYKTYGMKKVRAVLTSANSICSNIKYDSVYVNPLPIINISSDSNKACAYHIFNLTASSTNANVFSWDLGDSNTSSGTFVKHLYSQGGTYVIKVTAQTSSSCIDTAYKSIVVYPVPSANFDYTPKDTCTGPVLVHFTNKSIGANNFSWTFGNGNVSDYTNPETFYTGVGAYPIELICSNQFACFDTAKSVYNVYQMPKADLDFDVNSGCPQLKVQFTNKSQFGTHYTWYFGDGELDTSFNTQHVYSKPGVYSVKLVSSNNGVCVDSIISNKKITVFDSPSSIFDTIIDYSIKPFGNVMLINKSLKGTKFLWLFGNGSSSKEINPNPKYSNFGTDTIRLIAYSKDNCSDTSYKIITIPEYKKGLFVPNAFTPDYGANDVRVFKPSGIELKSYHLMIFNKWGELLWESTLLQDGQPVEGWNGIDMKGNNCMQGAYIWTIEAKFTDGENWDGMQYPDSKLKVTRGNVTLIR